MAICRGQNAFAKIQPPIAQYPQPSYVNDIFLYALFARITLSNNETIEFETTFDQANGAIDLCIPDGALPIFDQITGMQRGAKFKSFINWLIGSDSLGSGSITNLVEDSTSNSVDPEELSSITLSPNVLSGKSGVSIRAWGVFAVNTNIKTISLKFGNTLVAINDITVAPNGQTWELIATVYNKTITTQESIGECTVGAVQQSKLSSQPNEDTSGSIIISMIGENGTMSAGDIVVKGLVVGIL